MHFSLFSDVFDVLAPLIVGAALFFIGRSLQRLPRAVRIGLLASAIAIVAVGAAALGGMLPTAVGPALSWIGGATVLLALAALLLLGVAWSAPGRSFSSGFLAALAMLAGCLIAIEMGGRLCWRYGDPESWQRVADADGRLRQSSGLTCSPTAAVMLLHRHGITASEGQMAYLARTSLFGSDAHAMARALTNLVESRGWQAQVVMGDYETCLRGGGPFIAHVNVSGGHALLVESVGPEQVEVVDPLDGKPHSIPRAEFERIWDGTMIRIVRGGN